MSTNSPAVRRIRWLLRVLPAGGEAVATLIWLRVRRRPTLSELLGPAPRDGRITARLAARAFLADGFLIRMRMRCLWRAAAVTTMLRRRGVGARVRVGVDTHIPSAAHAEVEIGGVPLRPFPLGTVVLG